MPVRQAAGDGGADLPDMVDRGLVLLRQHHRREEPHHAAGGLRRGLFHPEPHLGLRDSTVGAHVVGLDRHSALRILERNERLRAEHAGPRRIERPRDPAVGFGRRRDEGDGESGVGRVVGPVEVGGEGREVSAVSKELVVGKGLRRTRLRLRRRDYGNENRQSKR